jgi:hypothetical protein
MVYAAILIMTFHFNELVIQPDNEPGWHPLGDEVAPFSLPITWHIKESVIAAMATER